MRKWKEQQYFVQFEFLCNKKIISFEKNCTLDIYAEKTDELE